MPYTVWPSAASRANPNTGGSVVANPGAGALVLAGMAPVVVASSTSFSTSFAGTETTISESGAWARLTGPNPDSSSNHSGWHDVSTTGGNAVPRFNAGPTGGGPGSGDYDDCYSLLTGTWPADMEAIAQIYIGPSGAQEIELQFRGSDTAGSPGTVQLYECLFNPNGLYELVRWNGQPDDFTSLTGGAVSGPTLSDSDWIKARVTGTGATVSLQIWYALAASPTSWNSLTSATDTSGSRILSGRPGIGFFSRTPETLNYGLRSYSVAAV